MTAMSLSGGWYSELYIASYRITDTDSFDRSLSRRSPLLHSRIQKHHQVQRLILPAFSKPSFPHHPIMTRHFVLSILITQVPLLFIFIFPRYLTMTHHHCHQIQPRFSFVYISHLEHHLVKFAKQPDLTPPCLESSGCSRASNFPNGQRNLAEWD